MSERNLYVTPVAARNGLAIKDPSDVLDLELALLLAAVSRLVDGFCGRHFYQLSDVLYFASADDWKLPLPDLVSVSEVAVDEDESGTYTALAASDYYLRPVNARPLLVDGRPYTGIQIDPRGAYGTFGYGERAIRVTGVFGWSGVVVRSQATVVGVHTASVTTLTVSDGSKFTRGQTLKVGAEQMYVSGEANGRDLTVVRGVNGTVGAGLIGGEAIDVQAYPAAISHAVLVQALREWERLDPNVPVRIPEMPGDIQLDPDVRRMLSPFVRLR